MESLEVIDNACLSHTAALSSTKPHCMTCPAGRPILALQLKHISMRWVLWVPTVDEVAEVLVGILRREHIDKCCLVAHSYGTAVASRLLQQHPQKILQLCMIDPVGVDALTIACQGREWLSCHVGLCIIAAGAHLVMLQVRSLCCSGRACSSS